MSIRQFVCLSVTLIPPRLNGSTYRNMLCTIQYNDVFDSQHFCTLKQSGCISHWNCHIKFIVGCWLSSRNYIEIWPVIFKSQADISYSQYTKLAVEVKGQGQMSLKFNNFYSSLVQSNTGFWSITFPFLRWQTDTQWCRCHRKTIPASPNIICYLKLHVTLYTGWAKKLDHFKKCITFSYNDIGRRSIIKMFSSLSGVKLILWMSPYLNILCVRLEKLYYTENTN